MLLRDLPPSLASPHALAPLLRAELGPSAPPNLITAAALDEAKTLLQLATARSLAPALLNSALFVKAIAYNLTLYSPGLRPAADLDLLTTPALFPTVQAALLAAGFSPDSLAASRSPMEVPFYRDSPSGLAIAIDLHYAFTGKDGFQAPISIPIPDLLARRQLVDGIPIPSHEDSLLLAAVNLVRSCIDRLVLVVDIDRFTRLPLDWTATLARARDWHLSTSLWVALTAAHELFAAPVDPAMLDSIAPRPWKQRWLRSLLSRDELLKTNRENDPRYRFLFKALSLDSWDDLFRSALAFTSRLSRTPSMGYNEPNGNAE